MPPSSTRRRLVVAAACLACAALVLAAIPAAFGRPLREIRIRWSTVSPEARQALERQFALSEPHPVDAQTFEYIPRDTSPAMLRSIAESDAVAVTDGIDRVQFRLAARGPLTERRGGWFPGHQTLARAAKLAAYLLVLFGIAVAATTRVTDAHILRLRAYAARVREDPAMLRDAALRGIPALSPEAAGVFRLVFLPLVLLIVARDPGDVGRAASVAALQPLRGLQVVVVPWLAAHPSLEPVLYRLLLVSGALAAIGVVTRTSFAVFVAAFTVWASVFTVTTGHHAIAALHMTLIGLLAAPWGDALGVDALWRRRARAAHAHSQRYGFVVWVPGFVFGLAFLAAAWSKVQNGPGWILNGTVRYHFVTDLPHALVPWGPWLTRNHLAAVLVSAAAVLAESTVIIASFTRSSRVRLLFGGVATAMLAGFALFQGLFWRGWWILLLSFLPWGRLREGAVMTAAAPRSTASWVQAAMIAALLVQQGVVSARHLEVPPMASAYDMYSATYDSDYGYEQSMNLQYQLLVRDDVGDHEISGCVVDDRSAARLKESARAADLDPAIVRSLCPSVPAPARIVLRGDRHAYDWDHARFVWRRGVDVIGPLAVAPPD